MNEEGVEKNAGEGAVDADNPYAYLERNEFTSEKFKIEIKGLPKYYGIGELKKLLNDKLKLGSTKVKPPARGSRWIYVCFRSEEDRQKALKTVDGYIWKNSSLTAHEARAAPDPLVKKRNMQPEAEDDDAKKQKLDPETLLESLKNSTIPWWSVPYEEQVVRKTRGMRKLLVRLARDVVRANSALGDWVRQQQERHSGLSCQLLDTRPSPQCDSYRNKCEFTVGINPVTGKETVGFRLSSYARGSTAVAPVADLPHVPQRMKDAAQAFEELVRSSSLRAFDPEQQTGHWRQLTCRLSVATGQLMLVAGLHPRDLDRSSLDSVADSLREFGRSCGAHSLYMQYLAKRTAGSEPRPPEHLMGDTHIEEQICGVKLRISPEAFFQVNSAAAEVLYGAVAEVADVSSDTCLLDVCCGSGAIGISLAKKCGQVLGVELVQRAVEDARSNAAANSVENCEFFAGPAEEILSSVARRCTQPRLLAVVDPPRAGLHRKAVELLRRTEAVSRVVFLSCDPWAALANLVALSRPQSKTLWGAPFVPVRAVAVDMFPHTPHCELVLCLERYDPTASAVM